MSTQGKTGENNQTQSVETKAKVEAEPIAEAIEEDDEFEEFEPCRWDTHDEDAEDAQQWQVSLIISLHLLPRIWRYTRLVSIIAIV